MQIPLNFNTILSWKFWTWSEQSVTSRWEMNRYISDTRRSRPDRRLESVSSYISIWNTFDAALITITLNRSCRGGKTVDIILTVIIKKKKKMHFLFTLFSLSQTVQKKQPIHRQSEVTRNPKYKLNHSVFIQVRMCGSSWLIFIHKYK